MLIAIDGPAGAGKSTVARGVAAALDFAYLDSGAMYRCVGLLSLRAPDAAPGELARDARIELRGLEVRLDGEDVSDVIRSPAVAAAASRVAAEPAVREALLVKQRELLASGSWVCEGRDIGTVVAPDADLKVYLTASPAERARRRAEELGADPAAVLAELELRDERDAARAHSPLRAAADAVVLDSTALAAPQVIAEIVALARARG